MRRRGWLVELTTISISGARVVWSGKYQSGKERGRLEVCVHCGSSCHVRVASSFGTVQPPVIVENQPSTSVERCQLAQKFALDFDISLDSDCFEFLVDVCERQDPFEQAFAPWPLRLYVIRDGKLEWISQPKDCSFDEAVRELMAMLNLKS
jgi:hypothetical protein